MRKTCQIPRENPAEHLRPYSSVLFLKIECKDHTQCMQRNEIKLTTFPNSTTKGTLREIEAYLQLHKTFQE